MIEEVTMENELNKVVYQKVQRDPYPDPTPLMDNSVQRQELSDLLAERIPRPATKDKYLSRLDELKSQIVTIDNQNAIIITKNNANNKAVDDKFTADIAAAKLDPDNMWEAIRAVRNYKLSQTDWTQTVDCQLSDEDKAAMQKYRQSLRDIPQNNDNPKQVDLPTLIVIPTEIKQSVNLSKVGIVVSMAKTGNDMKSATSSLSP